MRVHTYSFDADAPDSAASLARLVLCFGERHRLANDAVAAQLREQYPQAKLVFCSTSGEILGNQVLDDSIVVSAIEFADSAIETACVQVADHYNNSKEAGKALAASFEGLTNLRHLLVFADGSLVNGSELVEGINEIIGKSISVTGGLAGDGDRFESTFVGLDDQRGQGYVVGIGFLGDKLVISHASMGGWELFGPERVITRSTANELFEINHERALELYKRYLGDYANQLPGSALLFPLAVKLSPNSDPVVRTILSINEETGSMVFAGNVPEGASVRFMRANLDRLIDAAHDAGVVARDMQPDSAHALSILVSCVGRKIILKNRVEEEVEAVFDVLGKHAAVTGFYSYGEISPFGTDRRCELHNQTMTITTIDERD